MERIFAYSSEEEEHVAIADRPEIGAGAVVADEGKPVALDKGMEILPRHEVSGSQQEVGARALSGGGVGKGAARE